MSPGTPLSVGFIGAGLVTQAIHLPTLSRLGADFTVSLVQDRDEAAARLAAERTGARWTTSLEGLLADPGVEVVAVCSPRQFHADHVIAALRAGKRAVFCEKPLAWSEDQAREVARVSRETGIPVVVGAMHLFDRGWREAAARAESSVSDAQVIRSSIVLPMTDRFIDWSTQYVPQGTRPAPEPEPHEWAQRVRDVREAILELAIHDTPMIRRFLPQWRELEVIAASPLPPFGYCVSLQAGGRVVTMTGLLHNQWRARWGLDVISPQETLSVDFTPSWVHAGSAVARLRNATGHIASYGPYPANGYEGEWLALAAAARGDATETTDLDEAVEDFAFTVAVADGAEQLIRKEAAR